jgi:hypothetical protein
MDELLDLANQMRRTVESLSQSSQTGNIAVERLQAEKDEVGKYLGKRVAFLEEENFQLYKRLKDEYSQHARYNKFKDEVADYMGPDKKEEFMNMKKRARTGAHDDFTKFLNQQRTCLDERKETTQVLKDEHERKIQKIRSDAESRAELAHRSAPSASAKSNGKGALSALGGKGARKKDEPKEKKEKVNRPKTAPQIYNFEEKTKKAWDAAKTAAKAAGASEFPSLVAWGNAEYSKLADEEKERYESMARTAREELGLPPVVPRATPRAPASAKKKTAAAAAAAAAPKKKARKELNKGRAREPSDDDDDDDKNGDEQQGGSDEDSDSPMEDAPKEKRKRATEKELASGPSDNDDDKQAAEKQDDKEEDDEEGDDEQAAEEQDDKEEDDEEEGEEEDKAQDSDSSSSDE